MRLSIRQTASPRQRRSRTTWETEAGMRILLAVLVIAVLTGTAHARDMGHGRKGRGSPHSAEQQKADQQKQKAGDDAYRSAIGRIPDPREKYDPMRSAY